MLMAEQDSSERSRTRSSPIAVSISSPTSAVPSLNIIPDAVLLVSKNGIIVQSNEATADMFGYDGAQNLIGQPLDILIPNHSRAHHQIFVDAVFKDMKKREMANRKILHGKHSSGREFEVNIHLAPVLSSPSPDSASLSAEPTPYVWCFIRDMTVYNEALKARAMAAQHSTLVTNFLRLINHEIGTSTHAVNIAMETLKGELLRQPTIAEVTPPFTSSITSPTYTSSTITPPSTSPDISIPQLTGSATFSRSGSSSSTISVTGEFEAQGLPKSWPLLEDSVDSMNYLLSNMIDLRNLQEGNLVAPTRIFTIPSLFHRMVEKHIKYTQTKQCRFLLHMQEGVPSLLLGHKELINKCLMPLVHNAIKYSSPKSYILLSCTKAEEPIRHFVPTADNLPLPSGPDTSPEQKRDIPTLPPTQPFSDNPASLNRRLASISITSPSIATSPKIATPVTASSTSSSPQSGPVAESIQRLYSSSPLQHSTSAPDSPGRRRAGSEVPSTSPPYPSSSMLSPTVSHIQTEAPSSGSPVNILPPTIETQSELHFESHNITSASSTTSPTAASFPDSTCQLRFSVSDYGPGFPMGSLSGLAIGFFQIDASSTRRTEGGIGIGMKIAQLTAMKLNAELTVHVNQNLSPTETGSLRKYSSDTRDPETSPNPALMSPSGITAYSVGLPHGITISLHDECRASGEICHECAHHFETAASTRFDLTLPLVVCSPEVSNPVTPLLPTTTTTAVPIPHPSIVGAFKPSDDPTHLIPLTDEFRTEVVGKVLAAKEVVARSKRSALKILIVEDNPINVKVLSSSLKKRGFTHLSVAEHGQSALKLIQERWNITPPLLQEFEISSSSADTPPTPTLPTITTASPTDPTLSQALITSSPPPFPFDLILMDCEMPVMDGFECSNRLRDAGVSCPIFAITANATNDAREKCARSNIDLFLTKPLNISELVFAIGGLPQFAYYPLSANPHCLEKH